MKYKLYGDGIHDDAPAIQELLDERSSQVILPAPKSHYLIGKTLKIHGGQTLKLAPTTVVRLMDDVNASMLEDDDFNTVKYDICVDGGVWDMNNTNQQANPWHFAGPDGLTGWQRMEKLGYKKHGLSFPEIKTPFPVYTGFCMRFCRIHRFTLKNVTFRNPVCYAVQICWTEDFTVKDINFDFVTGAPKLWNMDGIHIDGGCKNGYIANLKGATYDDLVAITADDGVYGEIENIVVENLYAYGCHSAVRFLSHGLPVRNVRVSNVFGTYYRYTIGFTKYHGDENERGYMKNIIIENVVASNCIDPNEKKDMSSPIITIKGYIDLEDIYISNISREEGYSHKPMMKIDSGAKIDNLVLSNFKQVSCHGEPLEIFVNEGEVTNLTKTNFINKVAKKD